MSRKNRQCICCNTQYSYCPNCGGADKLKPSWYSNFCGEECKDIWSTATKFNMKMLSKSEAKSALEKYNLSNRQKYVKCVQRDLENIFKEELKVKRGKRAEVKVLDDVAVVDDDIPHEVVKQENE